MSNIPTVRKIYAAFGRGDVPAILEFLSESVEWEYGATEGGPVPWLQPRRGHDGARAFFESLKAMKITRFEVKEVLEQPGVVVALVDLQAVVAGSGRPIVEEDEVHVWRFDDRGKVARFRHRVDTLQHANAIK